MSSTTKIILYVILICVGWGVGEYPHIPSFSTSFYNHIQPDITVVDKCVSITLLSFSLVLFFVFWNRFWVMLIMMFFTWGFFGNALDEFTNQAGIISFNEKISLFLALLTTSILIWKHRQKSATK
jgi:hypothetical protein